MVFLIVTASLLFLIFCWLLLTADGNLLKALVNCNREVQEETIVRTQIELNLLVEQVRQEIDRDGKAEKKKIAEGKKLSKKLKNAKKRQEKLKKGKINPIDIIPLAGYRFVQLMKMDITTPIIKKLYGKCIQFKEKKEAMNYSVFLVASFMGNILIGMTTGMIALTVTVGSDMGFRSVLVSVGTMGLFAFWGYLPFDAVNAVIAKRAAEISEEFPQVVSKITLLSVAGMEVNRAWKLASSSGRGTLYQEMQRVNIDLDNNVPPIEAYSKFLRRCNNNYTTKLATAIIQNISKGNSEIVSLFRRLNAESWLEYKHDARRKGEKIQGKLAFPTMLLFIGIIIMIIVPAMSGFNF